MEDGLPGVSGGIEPAEQVAGEQRDFDGVADRGCDAVAAADDDEREVGLVALFGEVLSGATFGLWVAVDDVPALAWTVATRHGGRSVGWPRILLAGI
jgi:hypothetical protein